MHTGGLIYNPADTSTAPQACEVRIQYASRKPVATERHGAATGWM
jgi:hypothetical protein